MTVRVQSDEFDAGAELNAFTGEVAGAGAIVSFTGVVRDVDGGLTAMEIEHYPAMTERAIAKIVEEAQSRWSLAGALVIHRYGRLETGAQIMMVATASRHRVDAFQAAEFLMDYLKSRAPFWKKELTKDGEAWVEARDEDEDALGRW
ncbi:molybdenum cofactor biosynthesis protein MoaE [Marivivens donghaensis]|uniref:Molybdopterin synthase catalytic subunit n=1 Tax=Marivivens donghaensis TaxID=1699413 RepID=A0ABX0W2A8_9RHOB|nr:molybdenum cofactor biosynthesis protein MoaE [Marivivens donghaensis]NIY73547.1 molybdenum cofactor biosynthesis protein MoaE [Marivivens donghaensis]